MFSVMQFLLERFFLDIFKNLHNLIKYFRKIEFLDLFIIESLIF